MVNLDPLTEIKHSLIYLSCMMIHSPLPNVEDKTLERFLKGEVYVFPNNCSIHIKEGEIKVFRTKDDKPIIQMMMEHDDLIRRMNFFIHLYWKNCPDVFHHYVDNYWGDAKFYEEVSDILMGIIRKREARIKHRDRERERRSKQRQARIALLATLAPEPELCAAD